ncbi:MAG: NTF2-like N-terminal transpeptidase domain-containing protein [Gordonia sp. (in: high G+C Gram-positive bacteria)]
MRSWTARGQLALLSIVACAVALAGCGSDQDTAATQAARAFAASMAKQDTDGTAALTTSPSQAAESLGATFASMHAKTVSTSISDTVEYSDGTASFRLTSTWKWSDDRSFEAKTTGNVRKLSTGWKVQWDPGLLYAGLPIGGNLQMIRTDATPAPIVRSTSGKPFMQMVPVYQININPAATRNLQRSVKLLAASIKPIAPLVTAKVINDKLVAAQGQEVTAVALRAEDMKVLASDPARIAGVTVLKSGMLVMTDRRMSTPLASGLTNYWQAIRDATAGWQVQMVGPGIAPRELAGEQGGPGPDVRTSVNQGEQLTLGDAVVEVAQPATIMTLDAASGGILAMAQNPAAAQNQTSGDVAYPVGNTLDPVFSAVDGASKGDEKAANDMLNDFGLGVTFTVPGVSMPRSPSVSVSTAAFNPKNFTASMLNMGALGVALARSVGGAGQSVAPFVIKGAPSKVSGGELGKMDPAVARQITAAMAKIAKSGDASDLTGAPGLRALVGTNGPQGPGWFVGLQGGKVVVVYCEGDKSGTAALQVAQKYFRIK